MQGNSDVPVFLLLMYNLDLHRDFRIINTAVFLMDERLLRAYMLHSIGYGTTLPSPSA